ncbi:hypothetical protein ACLOJK_006165 [Asimina triloba]
MGQLSAHASYVAAHRRRRSPHLNSLLPPTPLPVATRNARRRRHRSRTRRWISSGMGFGSCSPPDLPWRHCGYSSTTEDEGEGARRGSVCARLSSICCPCASPSVAGEDGVARCLPLLSSPCLAIAAMPLLEEALAGSHGCRLGEDDGAPKFDAPAVRRNLCTRSSEFYVLVLNVIL